MSPLPYFAKKLQSNIVNKYRTIAYRGDDVECLICGWKGLTFFDHERCPNCRSFARTRLIPFGLQYFERSPKGRSLMHVAPNFPEHNYFVKLETPARYDRIDVNGKIPFVNIVGNLTALPMSDDTYDAVVVWHVFEHIPRDMDAMREVLRVLKPGGWALISVPIHPFGSLTTFEDPEIPYADYTRVHGDPDHCRSCGKDYSDRMKAVGFSVRTLDIGRDVDAQTRSRLGLSEHHVCWLAEKP